MEADDVDKGNGDDEEEEDEVDASMADPAVPGDGKSASASCR